MSRIVKYVVIFVLIFSVAISSSAFAQDAQTDKKPNIVYATETTGGLVDLEKLPKEEQVKLKARFAQLEELFVARGKARAALSKAKESLNNVEIQKAQAESDKLDLKASEIGLQEIKQDKLPKSEVAALSSSNADFVWDFWRFFYDTSTSKYVWEAQGEFDSGKDYLSEFTCYKGVSNNTWYNLGGDEGFGLASLHKDVNINVLTSQAWTVNSDAVTTINRTANLDNVTARGIGWAYQDKIYCGTPSPLLAAYAPYAPTKYDAHRRFAWMYFTFVGGTPNYQISFQGNTAHTWDSTDITGITLDFSGVGFTWANTGHQWSKPTAKAYTPN